MKNLNLTILQLLFICFLLSSIVLSQTSTENYIYIQEPTEAVSTISTSTDVIRTVQYFDGLGRPKETIQVEASPRPNGELGNLVTKYEYDGFGRQVRDYLLVPVSQSDLNLTTTSNYNVGRTTQYGAQVYFSEKTIENSPLNRVLKQAAPGNDWAKDSGHEIEFTYKTNAVNEVSIYEINNGIIIKTSAKYPPNTLYKTTTKNENGHELHEFKNKQGQVVLKRTFVASGTVAGRGVDPQEEWTEIVDTHYIYDIYGNLVGVVPPLAASKPSITVDIQNNLCYLYKYDERNRLVEKKLPGKGWEYMVYDKQDRLVATQDAIQRADGGKWLFTKYDKFGRVLYTGLLNDNRDRLYVQEYVNSFGDNNEVNNGSSFNQNGIIVKYTKSAFPLNFSDVLSVNYYDGFYNGEGLPPYKYGSNSLFVSNERLKGLITLTSIRILGTATWEHTYTYYDDNLRPIKTVKKNHLGGRTEIDSKLNFKGLPENKYTYHKRSNSAIEVKTEDFYEYDNMLRLTSHRQSINDSPTKQTIAIHQYNKIGQLANKKVGGTANNASDRWQDIQYAYNIRGWLTSINQVMEIMGGNFVNPPAPNDDLFSFEIKYNNPEANLGATPLYNGNISQTIWRTGSDNDKRGYTYTYDQLNRLRKADFSVGATPINAYGEYLAYDVNGNIIALNRSMGDAMNNEIDMDKLEYTYKGGYRNSNQLQKVVDNATIANSQGFDNGSSGTSDDYTYDANGNMISDLNKGISDIKYNHLNLPTEISWTGSTNKIRYVYNAAGQKVKKTVVDGSTTKIVDYLDGFQYAGEVLQFFPHPEGYVKVTPGAATPTSTPTFYSYNYVYNYTDHLGNVRLSYSKNPATNQLNILEENHYYPFGLKHEVYVSGGKRDYRAIPDDNDPRLVGVTKTDYQYKYNGFEYQDELGLGWYDYMARNYDPALGRWMNMDPLAEVSRRHSPYNYAFNNPLRYIDPDGMMPEDVIITGPLKQEAFDQLQSSVEGELNLTMDESGMVCYERTNMIGPLTQGAQDLMNAIDDTTITSTVIASDNDFVSTKQGPLLGNFMGNEFTGVGPIFTVDAKQEVNPTALKNFDEAAGAKVGTNMLHETIEPYRGGLISKQTGVEAKVNSSIYEKAHSQSPPQAGHPTLPTEHFFNASGTEIYRGDDGKVPGAVKIEYRFNGKTFHTVPKSK